MFLILMLFLQLLNCTILMMRRLFTCSFSSVSCALPTYYNFVTHICDLLLTLCVHLFSFYPIDLMKDDKFDFKKIVSENWIEPPKRERKRK